jgi:transcriptional regulator with XRE-family HTH domain
MAPEDRSPEPDDPPEDSSFARTLGRAIKVLRTLRGVDRKDLADRAGLSYSYLAEIENGKKSPSASAQKAIADALGMSVAELHLHAKRLLAELRRERGEELEASALAGLPHAAWAPPPGGARARALRWLSSRFEPAAADFESPYGAGVEGAVEQWLAAISDRLAASAERVERELEAFRVELERYRTALDGLRASEQKAGVEREELGNRLSRWQDRFDRRLQELTVEIARLTERQEALATQMRDAGARPHEAASGPSRRRGDER